MAIANLNVVFGKTEDSFISRLDDIVIPALSSSIIRKANEDTNYFFEDCGLAEFNGEFVLKGILIKDTILDVKSEYENGELKKTNKRLPYSPYSVFMIFLKNHRMTLVKNQSESPDIRSFKVSFQYILKEYIKKENEKRKEKRIDLLPYSMVHVTGIKTSESVKNALEDVEKVTQLTFQFYPLNGEWDYNPVFGSIDQTIRKVIGAKRGRMIFPSPTSKEGVADIVERTEGLVKTTMKVQYKSDSEKGKYKKTGKITDNEISDVSNVEIMSELDDAFDEIYNYKKSFNSLNVESKNNIIDYEAYLKKRRE